MGDYTQNNKYPFTFQPITDRDNVTFNGYDCTKALPEGILGFEHLDYDTKIMYQLAVGKMWFDDELKSIDEIINKDNLQQITKIYNAKSEKTSASKYKTEFERRKDNENFMDVIYYMLVEQKRHDTIKDNTNRFQDLYDLKYCSQIYRGAANNDVKVTNNVSKTIYPVVTVTTVDEHFEINLIIRNIPIPYKKFESSTYDDTKHTYIFMYPEYLLKTHDIFDKGYMKIETTDEAHTIKYNIATKIEYKDTDKSVYSNLQGFDFKK